MIQEDRRKNAKGADRTAEDRAAGTAYKTTIIINDPGRTSPRIESAVEPNETQKQGHCD